MRSLIQLLVVCLLCTLSLPALAQVDIVTESFETDGAGTRYTINVAHSNDGGSEDYWERGTDSDFSGWGMDPGSISGEDGSYYIGGEDMDNAPTSVASGIAVITLNTVNITGYTSPEVRMPLRTGATSSFDGSDSLWVEVNIDGGGYTRLASFRTPTAGGFNKTLNEDTDADGLGDGTQLTNTFQEFTWPVSTGSTLDLRISFKANGGDEELFIDYVRVRGSLGNSITTGAVSDPFCVTSTATHAVNVPFTSTGTFNSGNVYTAQLSDATGSFASPTNIGTLSSTANSGTVSATIPAGTASGSAYRVRVVADNPSTTGSDNASNLTNQLGPVDVTGHTATVGNTQLNLNWVLPTCYDEILVVARSGAAVTATPTGDGTAYTANSAFGSGTDLGSSQYAVYKGTASGDVITGLTNGTNYCFAIFTRIGTEWSGGAAVCGTPSTATVFDKGDFALVAVNSNRNGCGGGSGEDEISFVCFKNINTNDYFDFTDNGWQRTTASRWGSTEGVVRISRTGGTISAGTVITIRVTSAGAVSFISPDASWNATNTKGSFNLNSSGDQLWFMQNGTWTTGTGSHNDDYDGNILFGFTTNGVWTDFGSSTQQSGLYPTMNCFSLAPTGSTDYNKYTGPTTVASQRQWLLRLADATNWTSYANCTAYDAGAPNYAGGYSITVSGGSFANGTWTGEDDTDWFNCANWEDLEVPDINSDALIPTSGVTNEPTIGAAGAICASLTVEASRTLTINNALSTLTVDGNVSILGSMSHTAGLVTLTGANSALYGASGLTFNNLNINKDLGAVATQNSTVRVNGTTTFTQGYLASTLP